MRIIIEGDNTEGIGSQKLERMSSEIKDLQRRFSIRIEQVEVQFKKLHERIETLEQQDAPADLHTHL